MCQEVGQRAQQTLYLHWDDVIEQVSNRYSELVKRGRKNYPSATECVSYRVSYQKLLKSAISILLL